MSLRNNYKSQMGTYQLKETVERKDLYILIDHGMTVRHEWE